MVLGLNAKNRRGPKWENGECNSGSTKTASPTLGSIVGEGKIEFNESFTLAVNLGKDPVVGTDIVDLAEYGVIKETVDVTVSMNRKRNYSSNTPQPILFIKIDRIYKGHNISSLRGSLSKELPQDRKRSESVSSLMEEEYAEETEIASFTDDDVSSHSSLTVSSSTLRYSCVQLTLFILVLL
ncbi:hypothetical protein F3Y22_tig00013738pilonHSYRG00079 [Hibiscus syriacus]|uniref:C2 NT-type domain-containing protein n=1 Tax=Hibiscus syriacus TaxID=106335 RepID=A0A6A3C0X4_HIBSY|nr:hypothetical protein F3Y22_tig00013738pilonHSYRG00079 [Hibiscus syriacus]